jgi:signal transduction histidine kinase
VTGYDLSDIDRFTSRARLALSALVFGSLYLELLVDRPFTMNRLVLALSGLHFVYAVTVERTLGNRDSAINSSALHTVLDVLFAAAVSVFTEGATSVAYVFFSFAIVAVSCREGLRATLHVTGASVLLYWSSIHFFHDNAEHLYVMSPTYLGTIGCIAAFFGRAREQFEARVRALETGAERRHIARSLHDGHVQALAGANLRLEACRELLSRGQIDDAREELAGLQASVTREYDHVRTYIHSLAAVGAAGAVEESTRPQEPLFHVRAEFTAGGLLAEQVLQIMLEGLRNTVRHGAAREASLEAWRDPATIHVRLRDDGVGFPPLSRPPWSIASRVDDLGGSLKIERGRDDGARVDVELPGGRS